MSIELRAAEEEIDIAYRSNALMQATFAESAWYYLASCEEQMVRAVVHEANGRVTLGVHEQYFLADNIINNSKWPLRWLRAACPPGGNPPTGYDPEAYRAAWDLSDLAYRYAAFELAFVYAGAGVFTMNVEGNRLVYDSAHRQDTRYQAYDRIVDASEKDDSSFDPTPVLDSLAHSIEVSSDRFWYPLSRAIVKDVLEMQASSIGPRFSLPENWKLSAYDLAEFAQAMKVLWAISEIHFGARMIAASRGCRGYGYAQALITMDRDELIRRVAHYGDLSPSVVHAVVSDLTYGARGVRSPDPALQPFVAMGTGRIAWAPNILLNGNLERNLIVLMNKAEESRAVYTTLSQAKEERLRRRLADSLSNRGFRLWSGSVSGFEAAGDIDLAIISDRERQVLLLELKSFLAPAEPRELIERSEEIATGILQTKTRRQLFESERSAIQKAIGVGQSYDLTWAVASETSIGARWVQDKTVPVVRTADLLRKVTSVDGFRDACAAIEKRRYLPQVGRDYRVRNHDVTIGRWTLPWFELHRFAQEGRNTHRGGDVRWDRGGSEGAAK